MMTDETRSVEWHGVLLPRDEFNPEFVHARDRLADAAKAGQWSRVRRILDDDGAFGPSVNGWRVGGRSWFAPLHQAAWLGVSTVVAQELVDLGAWRSLRDAEGRRPVDIARARGHDDLAEQLTPRFEHGVTEEAAEAMGNRLAELVDAAVREAMPTPAPIRHLPVEGLAETGTKAWFPIPGMYGGFAVELYKSRLHVESWSRVVGGSGRAYVITPDRATLVDEGFV